MVVAQSVPEYAIVMQKMIQAPREMRIKKKQKTPPPSQPKKMQMLSRLYSNIFILLKVINAYNGHAKPYIK